MGAVGISRGAVEWSLGGSRQTKDGIGGDLGSWRVLGSLGQWETVRGSGGLVEGVREVSGALEVFGILLQLGPMPHHPHLWALLQDFQSLRYIDGLPSSFQFFLPLGAGGALHLPPTAFLPPSKEKRLPPELPLPKQLVCRWSKVSEER